MKADQRTNTYASVRPLLGVLLLCLAPLIACAQSYTVLHGFGTNAMGLYPNGRLVQGTDGMLYGTTDSGGIANCGQLFKVKPDGTGYTAIKDFTGADGTEPHGDLVLSDTTLYGTTSRGGTNDYGTLFRVNTDGSGFAVLKVFMGNEQGAYPAGLVLSGTTLYAITYGGGVSCWCGIIFKVNTDGSDFRVLHTFSGPDGSGPTGALVLNGNTLYGTTEAGGSQGAGTIFRINTDGSQFTVLNDEDINFCAAGSSHGSLLVSDTTLFGTIFNYCDWSGVLFKMNTDGTGLAILKAFTNVLYGTLPTSLTLSSSNLYGATRSPDFAFWSVFKIDTNGNGFTILRDFSNSNDGIRPTAGLMLSGTSLFGTSNVGGENTYGAVYKMNTDGSDYAVITNFAGGDGVLPRGDLLLSGSTFYGVTENGGLANQGVLFRIDTNKVDYQVLKHFGGTNGLGPNGGLVLSGAVLYGTTIFGGTNDTGTVFCLNTNGTSFASVYQFPAVNQSNHTNLEGAWPLAGLTLGGNTLYGTASQGGGYGQGTIFRVNTDGSGFTVLHTFSECMWNDSPWTNADGFCPNAELLLSGNVLFGTALGGGPKGGGTIFRLSTDGSGFTVLREFGDLGGGNPNGLVISGTTLYGTATYDGEGRYGTVFKINTDGSGFAVLKSFLNSDGAYPQGKVVLAGPTLYGGTVGGGITAQGTMFQIGVEGTDFCVLKYFNGTQGVGPHSAPTLQSNRLYGTTDSGGPLEAGVLFSLSASAGPPIIASHPESQTAAAGSMVTFSVLASGVPSPCYKWFFNQTNGIPSGTNSTLELNDVVFAQSGNYCVVVTNAYGSVTSEVAVLKVLVDRPSISTEPSSQTNYAGTLASFTVVADGPSPLIYQWLKDGVALVDGGHIAGAQMPTLSLSSVFGRDAGGYSVIVSNPGGSVTSAVTTLTVIDPFIVTQPTDRSVRVEEYALLEVTAEGTAPLHYQWRKDGVARDGATNSSLIITNTQLSDAGTYDVRVTNLFGSTTSTQAPLRVYPRSISTDWPTNIDTGKKVHYLVVDNAFGPPAANWQQTLGFVMGGDQAVTNVALCDSATAFTANRSSANPGFINIFDTAFKEWNAVPQIDILLQVYGDVSVLNPSNLALSRTWTIREGTTGQASTLEPNATLSPPPYPTNAYNLKWNWLLFSITNKVVNDGYGTNRYVGSIPAGAIPGSSTYGGINGGTLRFGAPFAQNGLFGITIHAIAFGEAGAFGTADEINQFAPPDTQLCDPVPDANLVGIDFNTGITNDLQVVTTDNPVTVVTGIGPAGDRRNALVPAGAFLNFGILDGYLGKPCNANIKMKVCVDFYDDPAFAGGAVTFGPESYATGPLDCSPPGIYPANDRYLMQGSGLWVRKSWTIDGLNLYGINTAPLTGGPRFSGSAPVAVSRVYMAALRTSGPLAGQDPLANCVTPPFLVSGPDSRTAETGSTTFFTVGATGAPVLKYQWLFNNTLPVSLATTNPFLALTNLQPAQAGAYSVLVTNAGGSLTSPPAMLSIIPPVERRWVPALSLVGESGVLLRIDYADTLMPLPTWRPLESLNPGGTAQFYFDTGSSQPQRFYRISQTNGLTPPLLRSVQLVPALTVSGSAGSSWRVEYINQVGPVDAWKTLETVTLTNSSQLYFDTSVLGNPPRLWRIVPLP